MMQRTIVLFFTLIAFFLTACESDDPTFSQPSDPGPPNRAPVATAGVDRSVTLGSTVGLDASESVDPDGDLMTYAWTWVELPAGSQATLSDPASPQPTFVPDVEGTYQLSLVVSDDELASPAASVRITATRSNVAPMASAGRDQTVPVGTLVVLDGSRSEDEDGDALSYSWAFGLRPPGSAATLEGPDRIDPTFVADMAGTFTVELVVNDGREDSVVNDVIITVFDDNTPPMADAGPDQTGTIGVEVVLDGSASSDPDGDSLGFAWDFAAIPGGTAAEIQDADAEVARFTPDVDGDYVVELVVDDGSASSAPDSTVISVSSANQAPVADAGPNQTVSVGTEVFLDGSQSEDPDGDAISFWWQITARPDGSVAGLSDRPETVTRFTPDRAGRYDVTLWVDDGLLEGEDTARVTAEAGAAPPPPSPPPPPPPPSSGCSSDSFLCDTLDGSTSGRRDGGSFSGGGWRSPGQIVWDLGSFHGEGALSVELDNWDPSSGSSQHDFAKQHIINLYEAAHGSTHSSHDDQTGFVNVRTGRPYNDLFKFNTSTNGFDGRIETRLSPPGGRVDPNRTHEIRIEWRGSTVWVFLDGRELTRHDHGRSLRFRYVFLGTDNSGSPDTYGPQSNVVYRNLQVFTSVDGGR